NTLRTRSDERHRNELAGVGEMLDQPPRQCQRLLRGMFGSLGREAPPCKRRKAPDIPRLPALGMGRPHLAVLDDGVPQPGFALVRLADHMECRGVAMGKPQDRLVVAGGPVAIPRPAVLVVP